MKRLVIACGAIALLLVGGAGFYAAKAALSSEPGVILTGCLGPQGQLRALAVGMTPLSDCNSQEQTVQLGNGDITAVTAGTGLDGGADSGPATLSLDPAYQLPQTCTTGQLAKANGGTWVCADPPASVSITPATSDQCAHGGVAIAVGSQTSTVCNGADGAQGPPGSIVGLSSSNGEFSIDLTDLGIYLRGPAGSLVIGPTGVTTSSDAFAGK